MGFLGRGIGTTLAGPVGYVIGNQFDQDKGGGPAGPAPWKPLTAKNVNIPKSLSDTLGTIGTGASAAIGANYAGAKTKLANDASARGMNGMKIAAPGSYAGDRLATGQKLDIGSLESSLSGQMGQTAYEDALQNREYGQNMSLADQIAALNRPSKLQEIFQGIGAVGKPAATYAGMSSRKNRGGGGGGGDSFGPDQGDLSLLQGFGGSRYGF